MNKKTILVVDDEPSSLELIDFVLRRHHYETLLALKAEEAFRLIQTRLPDLIILDLLMPGMSGMELCKRFKSDPRTKKIPILFLSAMVRDAEVEEGFRAGAAGFIFKPYDSDQLIKKIEEILFSRQKESSIHD